jgi:hypothetical protein
MESYTGYVTNRTLPGQVAQAGNGAVGKLHHSWLFHVLTSFQVYLEHRCFGQSNPYPDLTDSTLKYLTVDQAIEGRCTSGTSH